MKNTINKLKSLIESTGVIYVEMPQDSDELMRILSEIRKDVRYEECVQSFKNELKKLIGARAVKETKVSGAIITKDFYTRENFSETHTIANIGGLFYIVTCMNHTDYSWNDFVSFIETGIFNEFASERFTYGYFATIKDEHIANAMKEMFKKNAEENK